MIGTIILCTLLIGGPIAIWGRKVAIPMLWVCGTLVLVGILAFVTGPH
jgi:hypothetical protein